MRVNVKATREFTSRENAWFEIDVVDPDDDREVEDAVLGAYADDTVEWKHDEEMECTAIDVDFETVEDVESFMRDVARIH
jgi:hypothetical protein